MTTRAVKRSGKIAVSAMTEASACLSTLTTPLSTTALSLISLDDFWMPA